VRDADSAVSCALRETIEQVRAWLDQLRGTLPEGDLRILELRLIEERPFRDVAGVMGIRYKKVYGRYARALKALQRLAGHEQRAESPSIVKF